MRCKSDELMLALSTHKIQAGKDKIAKRLTLQQVCMVFSSFTLNFEQEALFSHKIKHMYFIITRQLIREMHWQNLSMQVYLTGLWNKLTILLKWANIVLGDQLVSWIYTGLSLFRYKFYGDPLGYVVVK